MKELYKKELGTYFNSIITYIFIGLMIVSSGFVFLTRIFNPAIFFLRIIDFDLPLYNLILWIMVFTPILMFLIYRKEKKKEDTLLYTSQLSSYEIIKARVLAISTVFFILLGIILLINIVLITFIYRGSSFNISAFILLALIIANSAVFTNLIYTLFKNPWISLSVSLILQIILSFLLESLSFFKNLTQPFMQGEIPVFTTIVFLILFTLQTSISVLVLNKKRNIV